MEEDTIRRIRRLGGLFHFLRWSYQPSKDPVKRLQARQKHWSSIREMVGGDVSTELLDFRYRTLELPISLVGPHHCQCREYEEKIV